MNELLRAERERRGLPDYARKEPPAPKPEKLASGLIVCSKCDEEFSAASFRASGTAHSRVCDDCWLSAYPHRHVECVSCGILLKTRGKSDAPTCRDCRRAIAAGEPIPERVCPRCERSCRGRLMTSGLCASCYSGGWRLHHGVNGKQTIGAWKQEPDVRRVRAA